ncbi:PREDICTED: uncharacterized protein LOC105969232 [Erythranthe guttata]|uniref:uncharacterized protein LOC105969232 n=1 Tax=Erythranthe guttata TaxID=4155 RepID=UPI00064D9471|nr:PREDICTED: uncharacterized protein LOC105969232 [Erythranthe guttata]|eukprot:XP_012849435.1 PREDICTED: uncharacterized protein LOC105969232 [Erythranthe guttata]
MLYFTQRRTCSDIDSSSYLTQGLIRASFYLYLIIFAIFIPVAIPTSLYSHASGIKTLSGSNFSEWYEQIQFTLGVMDLDLALLTEKPGEITDANSEEETSLPDVDNAMELLTAIKERFKSADKSLAGTFMAELTTIKYGGDKGIQEHILNMTDKAAKLGAFGMKVEEFFLVQFILNSLPSKFGPFKIHYNTQKDKWNLNEL